MRAIVTALLLATAGCGITPITESDIQVGAIEVQSSTYELARLMEREMERLSMTGDGAYVLHLAESVNTQPTSISSSGRATKRRLRYELTWRMEGDGPANDSGSFRYSQVLTNNDANHRADRLADRRFVERARQDGVGSVVKNLIHGGGQ